MEEGNQAELTSLTKCQVFGHAVQTPKNFKSIGYKMGICERNVMNIIKSLNTKYDKL